MSVPYKNVRSNAAGSSNTDGAAITGYTHYRSIDISRGIERIIDGGDVVVVENMYKEICSNNER